MLSSNANFDEQGFAAIIRDLERINLLVTGGNPAPASAQDQALQQGNQSVNLPIGSTMGGSEIATLPLQGAIPSAIPVPITEGGTAATTAADARTNLGLGTMAVVNSPVPVANGGTGATSAGSARTNLGVGIVGTYAAATCGSPVQWYATYTSSSSPTLAAGAYVAVLVSGGGAASSSVDGVQGNMVWLGFVLNSSQSITVNPASDGDGNSSSININGTTYELTGNAGYGTQPQPNLPTSGTYLPTMPLPGFYTNRPYVTVNGSGTYGRGGAAPSGNSSAGVIVIYKSNAIS